jgi:hypothetical protein
MRTAPAVRNALHPARCTTACTVHFSTFVPHAPYRTYFLNAAIVCFAAASESGSGNTSAER